MPAYSLTIPITPAPADAALLWLYHNPSGYGKKRIVAASAVNGAATSSTPSFKITLLKFSSAGTPALNGTIAASVGGTGDHWAANVPKSYTVSSTYGVVGEGEWVAGSVTVQDGGTPTNGVIVLDIYDGV